MLAAAIARWLVAVPLSAATFIGGFVFTAHFGQWLHAGAAARYACGAAVATVAGAAVGRLIVPHPAGRAACRVFGGVPCILAMLAVLAALLGHAPSRAGFAGIAATLVAGLIAMKAFGRPGAPA